MKRILAFLLALSLALCVSFTTIASAENGADYSNLSLEQLISMRATLDTEIEKRMADLSTKLIPGTYVVGRDVKAGSYILLGLMDKGSGGYSPQALVAESSENASYSEYIDYSYMKEGTKWFITVVDGNVIEIRSGDVAIQNAQPLTCGVNEVNPNDPSLIPTSNLAPGRYIAGKDIKAGTYVLVGIMDKGSDGYSPQALTSNSIDDATNSEYIDYQYMKNGSTWHIALKSGNVLEIRSGDVAVQEMVPLAIAPDEVTEKSNSSESEKEAVIDGTPIIKGIYIVGRDIQPGSYNIAMTACKQATVIATFANNENLSAYTSWDSANNLGQYSKTAIYVKKGQTSHIYLEDGDYLYIGDGSGVLAETDNSTLVRGVYQVGKELAPGSYFITLTDFHNSSVVATFAKSSDLVSYTSWDSANNLKEYSTASVYAKRNEAFHISLIEGEYLYIADGTGTYEVR